MREKFEVLDLIQELSALGERQGPVARLAAKLIKRVLDEAKITYRTNVFTTPLPQVRRATLEIDGQAIPCRGVGLKSGTINNNYALVSSLTSSRLFIDQPNINFNPACPRAISASNFYFAPAWAVRREEVDKIIKAKTVRGSLQVRPVRQRVEKILVGNLENPQTIIFTHYDSISTGATDNASSVAVLLKLIISLELDLAKTLIVFDGNEELSYDYPTYWGHGYRVFAKKHPKLIARAKKIVVVDSISNGPTQVLSAGHIINLAFPAPAILKRRSVHLVCGSFDQLMKVYHSPLDTTKQLSEKYLKEAEQKIIKLVKFK